MALLEAEEQSCLTRRRRRRRRMFWWAMPSWAVTNEKERLSRFLPFSFLFCFFERGFLCITLYNNLGCPGTHSVDQAGYLCLLSAGIEVCTTATWNFFLEFYMHYSVCLLVGKARRGHWIPWKSHLFSPRWFLHSGGLWVPRRRKASWRHDVLCYHSNQASAARTPESSTGNTSFEGVEVTGNMQMLRFVSLYFKEELGCSL